MAEFLWDEPVAPDLNSVTGRIARALSSATSRYQAGGSHADQANSEGPVTMAVYGPWGSGKTTLLKHVENAFGADRASGGAEAFTLWFEPWRYEREENLIVPLLTELTARVTSQVRGEKTKQAAIKTGMKLIGRVAKASARTAASFLAERVGLKGEDIESIGEDFLSFYEDESSRFSYPSSENEAFRNDFKELIRLAGSGRLSGSANRPVCIFIDDLDRCSAAQVQRMLESMKNFLWVDGVTYVLALDREQVTLAVAEQYFALVQASYRDPVLQAKAMAKNYLEKFFLYTFDLDDGADLLENGIIDQARTDFWDQLEIAVHPAPPIGWDDFRAVYECTDVNLRRLKRVARWLYYELALAHEMGMDDTFYSDELLPRFAEFVISENYSEFWLGMLANSGKTQRKSVYFLLTNLLSTLSTLIGDDLAQTFENTIDDVRMVLIGEDVAPTNLGASSLKMAKRLANTPAGDLLLSIMDADDPDAVDQLDRLITTAMRQ
ncbi:KAP family P-loop NTPase fold protein [Maricaulis parjimensis]|uniref:KAP family P-loop NTPase fold protein n=1 Tax=Maricaulis parjimensis TaxID=144023 RepID=UPI0019392F27|nr:P-loop NTPase fold protein [Maricaulis parjimensis]